MREDVMRDFSPSGPDLLCALKLEKVPLALSKNSDRQ